MLRVLHVIGKMDRAGAETLIMNIYRNIDRSKIQFDFLLYSLEKGDYDKEIIELGGKIYRMPSFKGYNYLDLARKTKNFFDKHPYKIVHGHIGSLAPMYLFFAKKKGAFTIAHSHSTDSTILWKRIVHSLLSRPVVYIADFYFGCSYQAGVDRFGKNIVESNRYKIIKNAIDVDSFSYSQKRHAQLKEDYNLSEKIIFGHVGRFDEQKNHKYLLQIFKRVSEKIDNAVLLLVGRGELENAIKKDIIKFGLEEKVKLLGVREDIPDLMNLFDVFVFPSLYEGLGIVCIEAQAAGLPCFVSDTVPDEAIVSDNIWKLSLNSSAEEWTSVIVKQIKTFSRKDSTASVRKAGYDIKTEVCDLISFYESHK